MKINKHVLFYFVMAWLLVTSFTPSSFASTAGSQAGISFTEKNYKEEESGPLNEDSPSRDTRENKTSSMFPQTGEINEKHFLLGIVLTAISFIVLTRIRRGDRIEMKFKMMMVTGLICGGALLGTATSVFAEEGNEPEKTPQEEVTGSEDGKSGTSHGYIKLTPGDDDENPTEPILPTDPPGGTGNEGILTLDNVAPLLFDIHKLEGKEQVYTSSVDNSNVQVTDKRGDEAGWNVQISQTEFIDVTDKDKILKGAKLVLPVGKLTTGGTNVSFAPTANSVEVNDTPAVLLNAEKDTGAGTWTDVFNKDEIELTVPAGNKTGEYMSTVTWALMDAPA